MIYRLLLRGSGLGAKFLLALAIVDALGFQSMALYGIAVALGVIASKALGLGFSSEINRRVSAGECDLRTVRRVLIFPICVAIAASLLSITLTPMLGAGLSQPVVALIALTAATEYFSFEVNTLVFSAHRSLAGAVLMFTKTGAWALIACIGLWIGTLSTIEQVLLLWVASNVVVVAVGALVLRRHVPPEGQKASLKLIWRLGVPFYMSALLMSATQYADRFVLAYFVSADELGKYVLSWSVTNVIQTLTYSMVAVVALPSLARQASNLRGDFGIRNVFLNRWITRSLLVSLSLLVLILGFLALARQFAVERPPLPDLQLSAILGVAFALRAVGDITMGGLIASKQRRAAIASSVFVAAISLPTYVVLIRTHGALGAAVACAMTAALGVAAQSVALIAIKRDVTS